MLAGLEVYGLASGRLLAQQIWYPEGLARFRFYLGAFLAAALPLLLMVPWAFAPLAGLTALAAAMVLAGPPAVLAPALFLLSAYAIGSRLLRPNKRSIETSLCSTLAGIAVYIFLMTLIARLPVHYPAVWLALLALPIAVFRRELAWPKPWPALELPGASERAAFALLVLILGTHFLMALKPETSADGLAMHLAVGANIAAHHAFTVEPTRLVWAVMPMGADFLYSIVYLLGGEPAARLLNFAFLLMVEGLLYGAVRRALPRAAAFLMLAVFASAPLVQLVTGELFVENLQAALVLGMMVALWRGSPRLAAALAGTAMAVKFGSLAFVVCALPFLIFEARRRLWSPAALFLATAVPTYAIAWWKTGNPVFPFFNPATEVKDYRFQEHLRLTTPFDLTFHSHRFYEGQDGSFGFHFLLLVPLAALALAVAPRRSAGAVGLGAAILTLLGVPNARYLYAAIPLLLVASAGALEWTRAARPALYRAALALFLATVVVNIWFLPASSYYHKDFYPAGRSPVREAARYFHRTHPTASASLLLTTDTDQADLAADANANHWHDRVLYHQINRARTLPEMERLMERTGIRYFLAPKPSGRSWVRPAALRELLGRCTSTEYDWLGYTVLRLESGCTAAERPLALIQPGAYDDFDAALGFTGDWDHSEDFDGPYLHSISYTNAPGAAVALDFEGRGVTYVFTRAPNRGIAEISIDGAAPTALDLYSPRIEWQSRFHICCLSPGRHLISIRATGRKQDAASDAFIDVDALLVE